MSPDQSNTHKTGPEEPKRKKRKALFSAGDRISDRYTVTSFVAEGAMGTVYKAEDNELDVTVALKVIRTDAAQDPKSVSRFKREIQLARKVTHPNVCRIFDIGTHPHPAEPEKGWFGDTVTFFTMEYVDGESLHEYLLRRGPIETAEAQLLIHQIGGALRAAHEVGVVHGDFKPANVILIDRQGTLRAVVTDFGLARSIGLDTVDPAPSSDSSDFVGTPEFMAPEQIVRGSVSKATDIYAFGLVVYQMLTGSIPFSGDSPIRIALERLNKEPTPPRNLRRNINRRWNAATKRCLERDPRLRFPDMATTLSAFESGRHPWFRWAWLLLLILTMGWLWGSFFSTPRPKPTTPVTQIAVEHNPRLAVLEFQNRTSDPKFDVYTDWIRQVVFESLLQAENSDLVSLERISRLSNEMGIPAKNLIQAQSAEKTGQNLDADYLIGGSLDMTGDAANPILSLRIECVGLNQGVQRHIRVHTQEKIESLALQAVSTIGKLVGLTVPEMGLDALGLHPPDQSDAWNLFVSGREKLWHLEFADAEKAMERAASLSPENPLPKFWLSMVLASQGQGQAAVVMAENALALCRDAPLARRTALERQFLSLLSEYRQHVESYDTVFQSFSMRDSTGEEDSVSFPVDTTRILETLGDIESRVPGKQAMSPTELPTQETTIPPPAQPQVDANPPSPKPDILLNHGFLEEAQAWRELGRDRQALGLFQDSLDHFQRVKDLHGEARASHNIGSIFFGWGELKQAEPFVRKAIKIWENLSDQEGLVTSGLLLAEILRRRGDLSASSQQAQKIIDHAKADSSSSAWARLTLAEIHRQKEEFDPAFTHLKKARKILQDNGDLEGHAHSLLCLARLQYGRTKWQATVKAGRDAAKFFGQLDSPSGQAEALTLQVQAMTELGQWNLAENPARKLLDVSERIGAEEVQAKAHLALGQILYETGKSSDARRHLELAVTGFRQSGNSHELVRAKEYLGTFYRDLGIHQLAIQSLMDVWRFWQQQSDPSQTERVAAKLGQVYYQEGGVHLHLGNFDLAINAFQQGIIFFERAKDLRNKAVTHNLLAHCLQKQEHWDEAVEELDTAMAIWQNLGDKKETARQWIHLADFHLDGGDLRVAESQLGLALDLYREFGFVQSQIQVLEKLELVLRQSGDGKQARLIARQRKELQRSLRDESKP